MTDTSRDSALSADSVVPVTTDPPAGRRGQSLKPQQGEKADRSAATRGGAPPPADVLDLLRVDRTLRGHAGFRNYSTSTDPYYADLSLARQTTRPRFWVGRDSQGYDIYAGDHLRGRADHGRRLHHSLHPDRRLISRHHRRLSQRLVGLLDQPRRGDLSRDPVAAGRHPFHLHLPAGFDEPLVFSWGKIAFVLGLLGGPPSHGDALQRPSGEAQRTMSRQRGLWGLPHRIITSHITCLTPWPR